MEELTLKTIIEKIKKNKDDKKILEEYLRAETVEELLQYYYFEKLHWCGCGSPESALKTVGKYLEVLQERDTEKQQKKMQDAFGARLVYDNELLLCLAYAVDEAGFTEHGCSIGGAWLEDDGKFLLWALKKMEEEGNDEFLTMCF